MILLRRLAVIFLIALIGAVSLHTLWGARGGNASYVDMACGFEGYETNCLDSLSVWHEGLHYYDSTLSVTQDTLETLKSLLWDFWKIEFAGAGEAAVSRQSILPLQVLQNKKSGCMGLSWLAMMVAEVRQIDLQVILLPKHVFLRYKSVNLEPNRNGFSYTDEQYREKYKEEPWTGLEFAPLTSMQFLGLAAFDIGNLYLNSDPHGALVWYRVAESMFPEYPGIQANQKVAKSRLPDHL